MTTLLQHTTTASYGWRKAEVSKNRWNFISTDGSKRYIVKTGFRHIGDFCFGFAAATHFTSKWHHIDISGKPLYKKRYDSAGDFVLDENGELTALVIKDGQAFRIDTEGQEIPGTRRNWLT